MFLLFGCGPYVSIVWRSTICFYYVPVGHMFLLFGCGPYVSIVWRSTICFYCVALGHMFLLCGLKTYVSILASKTICFHRLAPPLPITGKELVGAIEVVQTSVFNYIRLKWTPQTI